MNVNKILPILTIFCIVPLLSGAALASKEDQAEQTTLNPAQLKLGKRSFIRCQACHTLGAAEAHLTGPNLHGLFSSTAGEKEGFAYSEVLVKSQIKWTEDNMKEWLRSPFTFIPGNKMAFVGIQNDRELEALIAYLKEKTK